MICGVNLLPRFFQHMKGYCLTCVSCIYLYVYVLVQKDCSPFLSATYPAHVVQMSISTADWPNNMLYNVPVSVVCTFCDLTFVKEWGKVNVKRPMPF